MAHPPALNDLHLTIYQRGKELYEAYRESGVTEDAYTFQHVQRWLNFCHIADTDERRRDHALDRQGGDAAAATSRVLIPRLVDLAAEALVPRLDTIETLSHVPTELCDTIVNMIHLRQSGQASLFKSLHLHRLLNSLGGQVSRADLALPSGTRMLGTARHKDGGTLPVFPSWRDTLTIMCIHPASGLQDITSFMALRVLRSLTALSLPLSPVRSSLAGALPYLVSLTLTLEHDQDQDPLDLLSIHDIVTGLQQLELLRILALGPVLCDGLFRYCLHHVERRAQRQVHVGVQDVTLDLPSCNFVIPLWKAAFPSAINMQHIHPRNQDDVLSDHLTARCQLYGEHQPEKGVPVPDSVQCRGVRRLVTSGQALTSPIQLLSLQSLTHVAITWSPTLIPQLQSLPQLTVVQLHIHDPIPVRAFSRHQSRWRGYLDALITMIAQCKKLQALSLGILPRNRKFLPGKSRTSSPCAIDAISLAHLSPLQATLRVLRLWGIPKLQEPSLLTQFTALSYLELDRVCVPPDILDTLISNTQVHVEIHDAVDSNDDKGHRRKRHRPR